MAADAARQCGLFAVAAFRSCAHRYSHAVAKLWRRVCWWLWMRPAWLGVAAGLGMTAALVVCLPVLGGDWDQVLFRAGVLGAAWGTCIGAYRHRELGRNARRRPEWVDGEHHRSGLP